MKISKTKFVLASRCVKAAWLQTHRPELAAEISSATLERFKQGNQVGELARKLYPDGVLIAEKSFSDAVKSTELALASRRHKVFFEAAFFHEGLAVRVDILIRQNDGSFRIIEVKSSTKTKEEHIDDVGFQYVVLKKSGLNVSRIEVCSLNGEYERGGEELDLNRLFSSEDVTLQVKSQEKKIEASAFQFLEALNQKTPPVKELGSHCKSPYECPFKAHCWDNLPKGSVLQLGRIRAQKLEDLRGQGINLIAEIPDGFDLSSNQMIEVIAAKKKTTIVNREALRTHLKKAIFPLFFLDFETTVSAIPEFPRTRPFEQMPFQFSLKVLRTIEGGEIESYDFLASNPFKDPRRAFTEALLPLLENKGSIIVYHAPFEKSRLLRLGQIFPEHSKTIEEICDRIWDLEKPFANRDFWHPNFFGSSSIKAVLPALLPREKGYGSLSIKKGDDASAAFINLRAAKPDEATTIRQALIDYCALDTESMVRVLEFLKREAG